MTPEQLQSQLDGLVLAGKVTADSATLALWQRVREQEPEAWREMAGHVVLVGGWDLLYALARQCDAGWGCRTPLSPALAEQVRALLDQAVERWR